MIWIIIAIILGLTLGALSYYFTQTVGVLFYLVMMLVVIFTLMLGATYKYDFFAANLTTFPNFVEFVVKNFGNWPNHIQWSALLCVISFFFARIITWLLTHLSILPAFRGSSANHMQATREEYDFAYEEQERFI